MVVGRLQNINRGKTDHVEPARDQVYCKGFEVKKKMKIKSKSLTNHERHIII